MSSFKFTTFLFFFVLLFAANESSHAQNEVCRVTAYSINSSIPHSASFSDSTLIGEFNLKFGDDIILERFQHKESGINISVSVMRIESPLFDKKPAAIRLSIQLFKTAKDSYGFYGGSTDSIYDKNWKGLSVSSHVRVEDYKGYTFTVACEKKKKPDK